MSCHSPTLVLKATISHRAKTAHLVSCYIYMFHCIIFDSVIRRWGLKKRHFSLPFLLVCGYGSTSFDKITLRRVIKNTISGNPDPHSFSSAAPPTAPSRCLIKGISLRYALYQHLQLQKCRPLLCLPPLAP